MKKGFNWKPISVSVRYNGGYMFFVVVVLETRLSVKKVSFVTCLKLSAELRSRPIFGGSGSGSDPPKLKRLRFGFRLRLRLLVNCGKKNYEFVTTKKNIFSPDTKLQNLHVQL